MFSMATDLPEENRMKALTLLDEMSQFHWSMLKSVLLVSMLLLLKVFWVCGSRLKAAAKIMGFFAISLFSNYGRF